MHVKDVNYDSIGIRSLTHSLNHSITQSLNHPLTYFLTLIVRGGVPVIISGLMEQEWLHKASFINKPSELKEYLMREGLAYGTCILPVEYNGNYMDPKMTKVNLDILEGISSLTHSLMHALTHSRRSFRLLQ